MWYRFCDSSRTLLIKLLDRELNQSLNPYSEKNTEQANRGRCEMIEISNSLVLVVDDDPAVCELLEAILVPEGFDVLHANSGEEALSLFSERIIDMVFTDIQMGGMSGFELLARIAAMDKTVKTIIMTGFGGYDMVLKSLQAGAYDYLEKPLEDHGRITSIARKAYEHVLLARDNAMLVGKLKSSHAKLATANSRLTTLNKQLQTLAVTDSLTDLYNRRYIDMILTQEFERFDRYRDPFSIVMMDIDNFKDFNDTHGHACGDAVLKHIADIIKNSARATDSVARYGGEEFIMLLTRTPSENALIVAERVRSTIEDSEIEFEGKQISVTVSIGVAGASDREPLSSLSELMERTDAALYRAKEEGRNCICLHGDDNDDTDSYTSLGEDIEDYVEEQDRKFGDGADLLDHASGQ